jgi:hypothetical protein
VFLGLTLVFLVVHDVPLGFHLARVERDRIYTATERDAFTIAGKVTDALTPAALGTPQSDALMRWAIDSYLVAGEAKVVIVDGSGYLAASSDPNDTIGSDFTNRPEIADSLLGNPTSGARVSETLGGHIVYVAVPVLSGANVRGVVRLTLAESIVDNRVRSRVIGIVIAALMTMQHSYPLQPSRVPLSGLKNALRNSPTVICQFGPKRLARLRFVNSQSPSMRWQTDSERSFNSKKPLPVMRLINFEHLLPHCGCDLNKPVRKLVKILFRRWRISMPQWGKQIVCVA